jgi:sugar transferase (PEP-CTERM/EpsH1 system associated)
LADRARPQVLYVAHRVPHPPDRGDRIRTFHVIEQLARRVDVHLAAFGGPPAATAGGTRNPLDELCASVRLFPLPRTPVPAALTALATGRSVTASYFSAPGAGEAVRELAARHGVTAAVASSSAVAPFILDLPARRFVDFMDVDSDKWRQYVEAGAGWGRRWIYAREARKVAALERRALAGAEAVFVTAERERALLEAVHPGLGRLVVAGNGVSVERFSGKPVEDTARDVVFVGAMDYWPNEDAACWFAAEVWPGVRAASPEARFVIVGSDPTPRVRALAEAPGVVVTGTVASVEPFVEAARAVVVPIRVARGIQNKVLEGMAAGRPVVATPEAVDGIDERAGGDSLVVCADAASMGEAVRGLLADVARAREIGARARALMAERFSWAEQLAPMVDAIAG